MLHAIIAPAERFPPITKITPTKIRQIVIHCCSVELILPNTLFRRVLLVVRRMVCAEIWRQSLRWIPSRENVLMVSMPVMLSRIERALAPSASLIFLTKSRSRHFPNSEIRPVKTAKLIAMSASMGL